MMYNVFGGPLNLAQSFNRLSYDQLWLCYTAVAQNRPNCYWGRNCRTQKCKPAHAQYCPTFYYDLH